MRLSTHVPNTAHGCPAAGRRVTRQRIDGPQAVTLLLNADRRADAPLPAGPWSDSNCRGR